MVPLEDPPIAVFDTMRKIFHRYLPDNEFFKNHPKLRAVAHLLEDPNLWHLNRRSVSRAFAVGLFAAWIPFLGQMLMAAAGAIRFRANLPISVVLVLITNPFTFAPLYYFAYLVGARVLNTPLRFDAINFELDEILPILGQIWQPFLLGCLIVASVSSLVGYIGVRVYWRYSVFKHWKARYVARRAKRLGTNR